MSDLKELVDERYKEISELIDKLVADEARDMGYSPTNPTLKATLFLLLYNLIESTIYHIFETLFDTVATYCKDFSELENNLQKQYKKYDKDGEILENDLLELELSQYSGKITLFSGNLDARAIRDLLKKWGFKDDFHVEKEEKLFEIRKYRNILAHGEKAFKEVGKQFTIGDMKKFGKATHDYLLELVRIMDSYFRNKKYLKINN